jgi:hypothetical protein
MCAGIFRIKLGVEPESHLKGRKMPVTVGLRVAVAQ